MAIKSLADFKVLYAEMEKAQTVVWMAAMDLWNLPEMEPFTVDGGYAVGKVTVERRYWAEFTEAMEKAGNICLASTLTELSSAKEVILASREFAKIGQGVKIPEYSLIVIEDTETHTREYRFEHPRPFVPASKLFD